MSKDKKEKKAKHSQGSAQFKLANQLMKEKKFRGAIDAFSHAISLRPEYARFYFSRGNCFGKMGAYQRCLFDYSMAIRIDEGSAVYYGKPNSTKYHRVSDCSWFQGVVACVLGNWVECKKPSEITIEPSNWNRFNTLSHGDTVSCYALSFLRTTRFSATIEQWRSVINSSMRKL